MACTSGEPAPAEIGNPGGAATLSDIPDDVIQEHILTRLPGPALASAATTSSQLRSLSSHSSLWDKTCHATWPSTLSPRVRHLISMFPNGARSFFADAFPCACPLQNSPHNENNLDRTPELISAVDLFIGEKLLFSGVVETETVTGWFRCSPFRIDMVEPKDVVRTTEVKCPVDEDTCRELGERLWLSWIVVDPKRRRAVDVSSGRAVAVRRHWLSGEVEVRFARAVGAEALCSVAVTWGEEMRQVREVSFQMEDVDGAQMNGRESLVILEKLLGGERKGKKEEVSVEGYREFLKRKQERKDGKVRAEGRLDMICVGLAVLATVATVFLLWR